MYDIIYFGNDWYAENKTSSHHIAEQLSKSNRILYIECPGLRAPKASGRDFKKLFSKVAKSFRRPKSVNDNLRVYTLFQIPFHRFAFVRLINRFLIVSVIRLLSRTSGFTQPLLWFVVPHLFMVPGRVASKGVVYYCIDDYAALPDIDVPQVTAMDAEMTRKADIVFIASATLLDKKIQLNEHVHISPHGVDFDHFNRVYRGETGDVPDDVSHLENLPVIGFFGLIEGWIDLELIRHIAMHNSNWHILMIGRVAVTKNICQGIPNIHFIGRRPFEQLPAYTAVFDVAILPYKLNAQVINSNPIKLREYLAASKPVVSVRFPQVEDYADVVEIADNAEQFTAAIARSLSNDSPERQLARVDSVRNFTWEARVREILTIVSKRFPK